MGFREWIMDKTTPEECKRIRKLIEDYLDETLPDIPTGVMEHVTTCNKCTTPFLHMIDRIMQGKLKNRVSGLITCQEAYEITDIFIDHELDDGWDIAVEYNPEFIQHIGHCVNCFELYAETRRISKDMREEN